MDRRTSGARVYENMETSIPGIFACGNVVHVHDLVDYVSAESERAGAAAAAYVQGKRAEATARTLELKNGDGVSYTVPQTVRPDEAGKTVEVFFRVNRVTGPAAIAVRDADGNSLTGFRRAHLAPGEMEHILLPGDLVRGAKGPVTISIEEDKGGAAK